jgi:Outer membrane protein and related peptidoglycan-associated (lipo)proteins
MLIMKKTLCVAALSLLMSGVVMAQDGNKKQGKIMSWNFVEAQAGLDWTITNAKIDKLLMPMGALSFGRYFTPVVGARLHVSGLQAKSGFTDLDQYYKWNFLTTDADLLINLSNLFSKNYERPLNLIFVGGLGLNYAWDNDELKDMKLSPARIPLAWDDNRLSHNLRAGLRLETNVAKPLGLSLEVAANSLDDRFNSKTNDQDDWMISALVGVSYRFGLTREKPRKVVRQVEEEVWEEVPDTIIVKEKRPIVKEEQKKIEEVIFFEICQSDANVAQGTEKAIKDVADLMKTSEDATFTLTGYADKGTGNPTINKMYAQKRADNVTNKLIKEHGLDPSRLKSDSKGDTVQPFEENDKNRCVIITGEGTFKVTNYEEYETKKVTTKKVKKIVTRDIVEEVYD